MKESTSELRGAHLTSAILQWKPSMIAHSSTVEVEQEDRACKARLTCTASLRPVWTTGDSAFKQTPKTDGKL